MTTSDETPPDSWQALLEQGDGYLTPAQRKAFETAIAMVIERLQVTLGKTPTPAEQAEPFDFARYIDGLEERFIDDAKHLDELQQDAALTAARVVEHIADIISTRK
ncbi:hypothetical protein ACUY1T_21465 [Billgrantia sp. Q4P2]|uniref:hypothetical protein n=1 Tax=Billgrantia sp. Q4P2 TaxID=3463857 RepID=UPI004056ACC1